MSHPGFTFVPILPGGDGHLYAVISMPSAQNRLAIVNFTTKRDPCDNTCVVGAGEHPFFVRDSIALYAKARLLDADILRSQIERGSYQPRDPLSQRLLERVQKGALASEYTKVAVQEIVAATLRRE